MVLIKSQECLNTLGNIIWMHKSMCGALWMRVPRDQFASNYMECLSVISKCSTQPEDFISCMESRSRTLLYSPYWKSLFEKFFAWKFDLKYNKNLDTSLQPTYNCFNLKTLLINWIIELHLNSCQFHFISVHWLIKIGCCSWRVHCTVYTHLQLIWETKNKRNCLAVNDSMLDDNSLIVALKLFIKTALLSFVITLAVILTVTKSEDFILLLIMCDCLCFVAQKWMLISLAKRKLQQFLLTHFNITAISFDLHTVMLQFYDVLISAFFS